MTKRTNKFYSIIFSIFFVAFTSCTFANQNLNSVAAVVNKQIIMQSELDAAMASAKQQLAASANPNALSDTQLRKMVLQQLIDEKLQMQLAKQAKITVTDAEVSQTIARIAKGNGLTVAQLQAKIQEQGMSYSAYRKMIHKQLLIHHVQQSAVANKIDAITPADLQKAKAMYQAQMGAQQQFHVIDIVSSSKQKAEKIMVELKNGAKLNTVAPNSTSDLGWQTANTLPEIFLQQLKTMQPNDIAGPIQAPNGYHVIVLKNMRGQSAHIPKMQLQNMAYQMQFQKAVKQWLAHLRKTAYIEIMNQ